MTPTGRNCFMLCRHLSNCADKRTNRLSGLDSNIKRILNDPCLTSIPNDRDNPRFPMSLFLMANRVVAGDYLTDFTMMPRSFTGLMCSFAWAEVLPVMSVPQMLQSIMI